MVGRPSSRQGSLDLQGKRASRRKQQRHFSDPEVRMLMGKILNQVVRGGWRQGEQFFPGE
jgi:hypothetical protein